MRAHFIRGPFHNKIQAFLFISFSLKLIKYVLFFSLKIVFYKFANTHHLLWQRMRYAAVRYPPRYVNLIYARSRGSTQQRDETMGKHGNNESRMKIEKSVKKEVRKRELAALLEFHLKKMSALDIQTHPRCRKDSKV